MEQRTVIVTGAADGIGFACAEGLIRDGHNVTALDVKPIPAGLAGAAIHSTKDWQSLSPGEFNRVLTVNVTGSFLISDRARFVTGEVISASGGGSV
jgi:NAD(P)-dependent dehydrogenase (short-subunit alcohol dehydrogenase family)